MPKKKLMLIEQHDVITSGQKITIILARRRSKTWEKFLKARPLMEAQWFNALCGWLAGAYPDEFELDLSNIGKYRKGLDKYENS